MYKRFSRLCASLAAHIQLRYIDGVKGHDRVVGWLSNMLTFQGEGKHNRKMMNGTAREKTGKKAEYISRIFDGCSYDLNKGGWKAHRPLQGDFRKAYKASSFFFYVLVQVTFFLHLFLVLLLLNGGMMNTSLVQTWLLLYRHHDRLCLGFLGIVAF